MTHDKYYQYYEKLSNWDFDRFEIETEGLTDWNLYDLLKQLVKPDSRVLDLGTGGGEKLLSYFPDCAEILGTDYSPAMIRTARQNLASSGRGNITFKVMDNLAMDVPSDYFDIVVARHTATDPGQILRCLKPGGHLLIRGVDKYDCWTLKSLCGGGQGFDDPVPLGISDYERVLEAGFADVELVPIHEREYFNNADEFRAFLGIVPILDSMPDDAVLNEFIAKNTVGGRIRLLRNYYGITARKSS